MVYNWILGTGIGNLLDLSQMVNNGEHSCAPMVDANYIPSKPISGIGIQWTIIDNRFE
jgi:hypothetical protein